MNNKNLSPAKEAFPRPAKRTDGSYIYERIPSQGGEGPAPGRQQMLYKKRPYDEKPVEHAVPSKVGKPGVPKQGGQTRAYSVNQVAPKGASMYQNKPRTLNIENIMFAGKIATLTRVAGGQKTVISWQDAPDDLFYRASPTTKKVIMTRYHVLDFHKDVSDQKAADSGSYQEGSKKTIPQDYVKCAREKVYVKWHEMWWGHNNTKYWYPGNSILCLYIYNNYNKYLLLE